MFENKDFEVDVFSQEYVSLHPMASTSKRPSLIEEHFEPVMGEEKGINDSDASAGTESSEDELNEDRSKVQKKTSRVPRLYEVKDERHAEAFWNRVSLAKEDALPLGERVAALQDQQVSGVPGNVKFGPGGSREISFISRSSAKYKEDKEEEREGKRRGIQSLGLKSDRSDFQGQGRGRGRGRGRGGRGRGGSGGRGRGGSRGRSMGRGRR